MPKNLLAAAISCLGLCAWPSLAAPVVSSGAGATPASILGQIEAFRATLGGVNNGAGPAPSAAGLASGRREINWDAAALDAVADPASMPANKFNGAVAPFARGANFATSGSSFMISRRAEQGGAAPLFGFAAAGELQAFSAQRVFASVGAHQLDTTFSVPGFSATAASVSGFGAVFVDVELNNLSALEFFNLQGQSLGQYFVPASSDGGLSFLGVRFDAGERIGRVRITTGDINLLSHGVLSATGSDFVALDDFIYAEPLAVPELGTPALMALGLAGLVAAARRRRPRG